MIKLFIYSIIILLANTIGSISGMGGGLIIKPALQLLDWDNVILINFYSSFAVFVMSISSTWKQLKSNNHVDKCLALYLSLGSVLGGMLGNTSFKLLHTLLGNDKSVVIQMLLVIISLIVSLVLTGGKIGQLDYNGKIIYVFVGLFLGWLATLLGIGGGPINIAFFMFLFGIGLRQATIYSIITIFFSQGAKLLQTVLFAEIADLDFILLLLLMFSAILGGILGAKISNAIKEKHILLIYNSVVIFVLLIDSVNLIKYLII